MPGLGLLCLLLLPLVPAQAFPPAPYHVIYGLVKNEYGTPFTGSQAQVLLQTSTGVLVQGMSVPGLASGVNYQIQVPMDSGLTPTNYMPTALRAAAPFTLVVVVGGSTNLPIQMSGTLARLGQPGQRTRLDLTIGEDLNGDGIPDAWENAFLSSLNLNLNLADLRADGVYTTDGRTLEQQFLMGNIPFNPADDFAVQLLGLNGDSPLLQITTMTGRSYTVLGSADLATWAPLSFYVPAEGPNPPARSFYFATDIRTLKLQVLQTPGAPPARFFRLSLQ